MLEELHIKNLALVEDITIDFKPGFTVFTGETGAGKTVLLNALKLLLGDRADTSLVRSGSEEALIEARFRKDDDEIIIRRRISASGKSKCYINGKMATLGELTELLGASVDLHGQHEHQRLLHPSSHISYLDSFIGNEVMSIYQGYQEKFKEHKKIKSELQRLQKMSQEEEERLLVLKIQLDEIEGINPLPDEDISIEGRLPMLRHGEKLAEAARAIYNQINDEIELDSEIRSLVRKAEGLEEGFDNLLNQYREFKEGLRVLGAEFREYGESINYDVNTLNKLESRLNKLNTLKRKYGATIQDVLNKKEKLRAELEEIDSAPEKIVKMVEKERIARLELEKAGELLMNMRRKNFPVFISKLTDASKELSMPSVAFEVQETTLALEEWTLDNPHQIEFLFSPNKGQPLRPLVKIASGGEASRVMLALKSVLGNTDPVSVLVFDEIDTGIGGNTALTVGKRLRELAVNHQILVITHLAQVAAFAENQIVVSKTETDTDTITSVEEVVNEDRVIEIARMLSGEDNETALKHARELLNKLN